MKAFRIYTEEGLPYEAPFVSEYGVYLSEENAKKVYDTLLPIVAKQDAEARESGAYVDLEMREIEVITDIEFEATLEKISKEQV